MSAQAQGPATMAEAHEQMRRARLFAYVARRSDLISFETLVDWYGRENTERKAWALQDLGSSAVRGEFGPKLYFMPVRLPTYRPFWIRRTANQVGMMRALHGQDETADLWAPRRLCATWLTTRQITLPPWVASAPAEPTAAAVPAAARPKKAVPKKTIDSWFAAAAAGASPLDREATITRCMNELGCNRELAREGFTRLPKSAKAPRGRPSRKSRQAFA